METTHLDHLYLTVRDLGISEAFPDQVKKALDFNKGIAPVDGDPHFHYFNQRKVLAHCQHSNNTP